MKKIALLTVLIVLFSTSASFAQCNTYVSGGTIDGEIWTQAGSPYCIMENMTIANLTIEPGVKVEFLDNYQFYVQPDGVLTAIGTEGLEIEFISNEINGVGWQGIHFDNSSSVSSLVYCTIQDSINRGIRIIESTPTIENCTISGNKGTTGAGMYISLTTAADDNLIITDCEIIDNDSTQGGGGVMAIVELGSLTFSGCKIQDNFANRSLAEGGYYGGGVNATVGLQSNILMDNCEIVGNTNQSYCDTWNCSSSAKGGGIYKTGLGYLFLDNSIVKDNLTYVTEGGIGGSEHVYGYGGGLFVEEGGLTATNSIISSNVARAYGADAYGYGGGGYASTGMLELINCTVSNNSAEAPGYGRMYAYGGGLFKATDSNMILTNSIVYFNEKNVGETINFSQIYGDPTVTYSDVQDGYAGDGNIDADPLFIDQINGNYHLSIDSPCIDVGTAVGAPDHDIDGDTRPQGAGYDIGADEYWSGQQCQLHQYAISPPSGYYATTQGVDLVLFFKPSVPEVSVVGVSGTLNGNDVTSALNQCLISGTLSIPPENGETFRCPSVLQTLGGGSHNLSVTLDLSDTCSKTITVKWNILNNTEP